MPIVIILRASPKISRSIFIRLTGVPKALAITRSDRVTGQVFNIGGGAGNTLTIWTETGPLLEKLLGRPLPVGRGDWRPGDQRICVMDIRKAQSLLGWSPQPSAVDGVAKL